MHTRPPSVLIADDDPATRALLITYCNRWGYQCLEAEDGEQAQRLLTERDFDIVLCDWKMPKMEGPDLCREIRAMNKDEYTYVILFTIKDSTENIVQGIEAGADDYVTKPLNPSVLKVRIEAGIRLVRLERSLAASNRSLRQGLDRAASTLRSMLPTPRNDDTLSMSWLFRPCTYLGGDFFNINILDENRLSFYIIDVSGHGVEAALFAVTVGDMLRSRAKIDTGHETQSSTKNSWIESPSKVANVLNQRFPMLPPSNIYFTLFYGVMDRRDYSLRYVRAGHPPAVIIGGPGPVLLDNGDPPIGFFENQTFTEHKIMLEKKDRIYLFSDGITDLKSETNGMFGTRRLVNLLLESSQFPLSQSVRNIEKEIDRYQPDESFKDDLSLLALEF